MRMFAAMNASVDRDPWRNFRVILWHNIPLIALFSVFTVLRVVVSGRHLPSCLDIDFVCSYTERYGDLIPLVSSFTAEAKAYGSSVNIPLIRELLFFNFIIWLLCLPISAAVFLLSVKRLHLRKATDTQRFGVVWPSIILFGFLALVAYQNFGDARAVNDRPLDLMYVHWSGALRYNAISILSSMLLMLALILVFDVRDALRTSR